MIILFKVKGVRIGVNTYLNNGFLFINYEIRVDPCYFSYTCFSIYVT